MYIYQVCGIREEHVNNHLWSLIQTFRMVNLLLAHGTHVVKFKSREITRCETTHQTYTASCQKCACVGEGYCTRSVCVCACVCVCLSVCRMCPLFFSTIVAALSFRRGYVFSEDA